MTGDKAIEVTATLIAKKSARAKGTSSENYIEGFKDALVWAAKGPEGLEILAALVAEAEAEQAEQARPTDSN